MVVCNWKLSWSDGSNGWWRWQCQQQLHWSRYVAAGEMFAFHFLVRTTGCDSFLEWDKSSPGYPLRWGLEKFSRYVCVWRTSCGIARIAVDVVASFDDSSRAYLLCLIRNIAARGTIYRILCCVSGSQLPWGMNTILLAPTEWLTDWYHVKLCLLASFCDLKQTSSSVPIDCREGHAEKWYPASARTPNFAKSLACLSMYPLPPPKFGLVGRGHCGDGVLSSGKVNIDISSRSEKWKSNPL